MAEISLFEAKTHLSGIITQVEESHAEFVITKRGKPVAKIVPIEKREKHDIAALLKEMDTLKDDIGHTGISLAEILKDKDEGRK